MFRSKSKLSCLVRNCQNQIKNKTGTPFRNINLSSSRFLTYQTDSCSIFAESNGILKSISKTNRDVLKKSFAKRSDPVCWRCKQILKLKKFTCADCGALQHPKEDINYFELFGITQTYDINLEDLSTKFKNLQMSFHPDKFANNPKEEQKISESYSTVINKAYMILKNPLKRGFYLLELQKLPVDPAFPIGQEFLVSIMEKNEELDSITTNGSLEVFLKSNNDEMEKLIKLVSEAFRQNKWSEAKSNLLKLNYFINLENKIKDKANTMSSLGT